MRFLGTLSVTRVLKKQPGYRLFLVDTLNHKEDVISELILFEWSEFKLELSFPFLILDSCKLCYFLMKDNLFCFISFDKTPLSL